MCVVGIVLRSHHNTSKNSTTGADASGEFQLAAYIQFIHALATHSEQDSSYANRSQVSVN